MEKANTHGTAEATGGVVAIEAAPTMAADITDDEHRAENLRLQLSSFFQAQGETWLTRGLPPPPRCPAGRRATRAAKAGGLTWGGAQTKAPPTPGRCQIASGQTFRWRAWSAEPPEPCWSSRSGSPEATSPLGSRSHGPCLSPEQQRSCAALCPNATIRIARQLSTKVASLCARAGRRSFSSAFASI